MSNADLDRLVGDIAGRIVMLREPCYGGVAGLDDSMAWERARAIAMVLTLEYDMQPRHVEEQAS